MVDPSEVVRTFIALDVPSGLKDEIAILQRELRGQSGGKITWPKTEGIHLTLKFLGDIKWEAIEGLVDNVRAVAGNFIDFSLKTGNRGAFPRLSNPRTLWVAVDGGQPLLALREALEDCLDEAGYARDSDNFRPHLTIGRVKSLDRNSNLTERFIEFPFTGGEWMACNINVMSSILKPSGAEYSLIASLPFALQK